MEIISKRPCERLPYSFEGACQHQMWAEAIDREYNALNDCGTWKYIKQTPEMDPLPFKWTLKIKDASTKTSTLYKARCCLCGNHQKAIRDFDHTNIYAPVVKHETIRMFLARVAAQPVELEGANIDNAYVYEQLEKLIIMKQPFNTFGRASYPGHVCPVVL